MKKKYVFILSVLLLGVTQATKCQCTVPPVTPSSILGASVFCAGNGQSYTVSTAAGATSYSWSLPGSWTGSSTSSVITTNSNGAGAFTISAAAINTCGVSSPVTFTVMVNPVPNLTLTIANATICSGHSTAVNATGATTLQWSSAVIDGIPFFPNTSFVYTVTGYNNFGCSATATIGVTVIQTPFSPAVSSTPTICLGSSAVLSTSNVASYTWVPGNLNSATIVVTPTVTTTYTLYRSNIGCNTTATVQIAVLPGPTVSISGPTFVCQGGSATLTASGATLYNWLPGSGSSIVVTPTATSVYTVAGNLQGCTGTAQKTITVGNMPQLLASASTTEICMNMPVPSVVSASGAVTYTWSHGLVNGGFATPMSTTVYTVTGTGVNGCLGTATLMILVHQVPSLTISGPTAACAGDNVTLTANGALSYSWNMGMATGTVFSFVAFPGFPVVLQGADSSGCSQMISYTVSVFQPTVKVTGDTILCVGKPGNLFASGATTYSWNAAQTGSSISVVATTNTFFLVVGKDLHGCADSVNLTLTVNPNPTVTASTSQNTVCAGETATLFANGALTFTWTNGPANYIYPVKPSSTRVYVVKGESFGCITSYSITQFVDKCTDIIELFSSAADFNIYPSPCRNEVTVSTNSEQTHLYVEIIDLHGRIVRSTLTEKNEVQINVDDVAPGLYLVRLHQQQTGSVRCKKLIIEK
jgi:hypothetical protein